MCGQNFDLVIRNGTVIDGTGAAGTVGDVGVTGDRITSVGDLHAARGGVEIDAVGKVVSPGFIDVHTHDDNALLVKPDVACKTSQGVTTVVVGNCGISLAPLAFRGSRPPPPLDLLGDEFKFPRMVDYVTAIEESPPGGQRRAAVRSHNPPNRRNGVSRQGRDGRRNRRHA
jgi:N-acyl-D-amino-acid deacylase